MTYHAFILFMSFIGASLIGFSLPAALALFWQREKIFDIAVLIISLAFVGACAGIAGGMSRTAAVGTIIPAFLSLLGGVSLYLFGVETSRGLIASFGAAALSLSLLSGFVFGSMSRATPEDHRDIRKICATAYSDADLLSNNLAFERFNQRLGGLCQASMSWRIAD